MKGNTTPRIESVGTFAQLEAATQTSLYSPLNGIDPNYTYHWSNNQTTDFTTATTTGWYWVTITSEDGCYTSTDSIYVIIHPPPPLPNISDNVPINTNTTNPQPVIVCADSVMLTGGNYGNNSVNWQGPAFPNGGVNTNPVWVDTSGTYVFTVTDQYGCVNALSVVVELDSPLDSLFPAIHCLDDTDWNDSLQFCENAFLSFLPYDSVNNPSAIPVCIDESVDTIYWTITPNTSANILPYTDCEDFANAISTANVTQTGWYTITGTISRHNECGTDTRIATHSYYCDVLPAP